MNPRVNLLLPEIRRNPYPLYAELRRSAPVCQVDPGGMWVVTRHDDVQRALRDTEAFSSAGFQMLLKPPWLGHNPVGDSILAMDPPEHTKLRALAGRAFTARTIARLTPRITSYAAELVEHLGSLGEADFIAEFAAPLPAVIIGEILGLDPSLHRHFKRWGVNLSSITPAPPSDEVAAAIRTTVREMETYLEEVVQERRRRPADDFVSDLIRAEINGVTLSDAQVVAFLFLVLPAGFETTTNLFANAMLGLLERPQDVARLRSDPGLIPAFIDEVLRHEPPVHGIPRFTTADVELGGAIVPKGSIVLLLLGSANRDETQFPDADRFDMDRGRESGVAFGHGIHFCIGAPLARLEGRIGLEALLRRFSGFVRLPGELEWSASMTVRGPVSLPLRFLPA